MCLSQCVILEVYLWASIMSVYGSFSLPACLCMGLSWCVCVCGCVFVCVCLCGVWSVCVYESKSLGVFFCICEFSYTVCMAV